MKKIFIHIPKNGGTGIRRQESPIHNKIIIAKQKNVNDMQFSEKDLLRMGYNEHPGYHHRRWRDFKKSLTNQYDAFAVVRNPWSRVVSQYTTGMFVQAQFTNTRSKRYKDSVIRPSNYTFEQFLDERYLYGKVPYLWHHAIRNWYSQREYVISDNGELKCDILRMEYLNEDINTYLKTNFKFNVSNSSNNKINYKDFYNETTKQIIAEWYKDDIEFFGFTFEGSASKNIWCDV